jgi:hypothetical protein
MPFPFAALAVSTSLVISVAGGVPKLDMGPTCRSPARLELGGTADVKTCLQSEQRARDLLVKEWASFPASDQRECTELVTKGGPPSYVELYTCLEMSREAARLRRDAATKKRTEK